MSDTPQGDGWWQASDGKFYPPESAPGAQPTQPVQPQQPVQPTQQPAQPQANQPQPAQQVPGQVPTPPPYGGPAGVPGAPGTTGMPPGAPGEQGEEEKKGKGKLIAALVIILLLVAGGIAAYLVFGGGDDDDEPATADSDQREEDIGDATGDLVNDGPIEFNKEYTTSLEADRTEARYTLDAPDGAIMTVEVSNDPASTNGVLMNYESEGERFANGRVQPGAAESQQVVLDSTGGAEFELAFTEGPAEFTFKVGLEIQDDAGKGGDAGEELDGAFEIGAGDEVSAMLADQDRTDYFTVELQPGTELVIKSSVGSGSDSAALFNYELAGDRLHNARVQPGADDEASVLLSEEDSGTLEIIVTEGASDYSFTVDFVTTDDGGGPGDAPAELADARKVPTTAPVEGTVGNRDKGDYYLFDAPAATFNVTATSAASSESAYLMTIEDANGSRLTSVRVQPGATQTEAIEAPAGSQLRMEITEGRAEYSISIG